MEIEIICAGCYEKVTVKDEDYVICQNCHSITILKDIEKIDESVLVDILYELGGRVIDDGRVAMVVDESGDETLFEHESLRELIEGYVYSLEDAEKAKKIRDSWKK